MTFNLSTAACTGNPKNKGYPNKLTITNADELKAAVAFDHVCGTFKNDMRSVVNFESSDCIVMDCDNDHSDNPNEWITPEKVTEIFSDVSLAVVSSRSNMKAKGGKSARPRFHVYFPITPTNDAAAYTELKKRIHKEADFFDGNALDAARFIYGNPAAEVLWVDGINNIDDVLNTDDEQAFSDYDEGTRTIAEGGRNNAMSHHAGRVIMRFGDTDKARELFNKKAEKCDPPLDDDELETIWSSAIKFGKKMAAQPGYIPPDQFSNWQDELQYSKKGILLNTLHNLKLIMENDENLKAIVFNQLADGMEIRGDVPWKHPARFWRDADDAQLICYIDDKYGSFSARNYDVAVTKVADDRSYHPIHEMFDSLPEWDKVPRVETLLIDYLGAEDSDYVRAVTRKSLCAAYCRVYEPGIKFDYLIVLNGAQGIGKSTLIAKLGGEWYSDSLNISDMNDKTAAEKLQGYWILEIGELAGMKKADIDKVKAFISRQDDKYRASFGRRVTPHPRQCIFFGTTNSENGYLRDVTGNRRFWNVKVSGNGKFKPWELTDEVVKQVWAEVIEIAKSGEKLYLDTDLEEYAKREQREAMEQDDREGIVQEYLDMLLPDDWDSMDIYRRRDYFRDTDDPTRAIGTVQRQIVSNIEIWCECFGKAKEEMRPSDSYAISAIMIRLDGWQKTDKFKRLSIYGKQRIYTRTS